MHRIKVLSSYFAFDHTRSEPFGVVCTMWYCTRFNQALEWFFTRFVRCIGSHVGTNIIVHA